MLEQLHRCHYLGEEDCRLHDPSRLGPCLCADRGLSLPSQLTHMIGSGVYIDLGPCALVAGGFALRAVGENKMWMMENN
jgi:hypothetical protein